MEAPVDSTRSLGRLQVLEATRRKKLKKKKKKKKTPVKTEKKMEMFFSFFLTKTRKRGSHLKQ